MELLIGRLLHKNFRLYFPILFILIHAMTLFAVEVSNDEEKQLSGMKDDTVKVNLLLRLGENYCSKENSKALLYLQEAYTIATANNYRKGIAKSLLWQGRVYYYTDEYPLALKYLGKAKTQLEKLNDVENLSFLHFAEGEIFKIRGDYIHAIESYQKAIELAELTGEKKHTSTYYSSIGTVLLNRNKIEKAIYYFKKSITIKSEIGDESGVSNILTCLGMAYERLNKLDSSLIYHNKALAIRKHLNMNRAIASSEYNIAGIHLKLGNYDKAEKSLLIALNNYAALEEKTGVITTNLSLALVNDKQGKPDAISIAEGALNMASRIDNPRLISHGYQVLSEIYNNRKDYKKAYEYFKRHTIIQDSLFSTEKERILTEMEEKYQSELKDNEILLLKEKSRIQRNNNILLVVLLIVLLLMTIILIFMFRYKSTAFKRQQKVLEQESVIHVQESKIIENENLILQEKLESKNRELASKALEMIRFNDTISDIIAKLESLNNKMDKNPEIERPIKEIINNLENHTKQNIWTEFEKIFKNIHSGFYDKLLDICPDLTATEIKTAALLRLNLNTKEIAAISFKSEGGVKTIRYRLRKKLNLGADEKLIPYLMQI